MNRYKDDQSELSEQVSGNQSTLTSKIQSSIDFSNPVHHEKPDEKEGGIANPIQRVWKKPNDMPKRPMCAYNLFYQLERERIVEGGQPRKYSIEDINRIVDQKKQKGLSPQPKRKHRRTHGKISFADLARLTAKNWKSLDDESKAPFHERAAIEKKLYREEIKAWNALKDTGSKQGGSKRSAQSSTIEEKAVSHALDLSKIGTKSSPVHLAQHDYPNAALNTIQAFGMIDDSLAGIRRNSTMVLQSDLSPYLRSIRDSAQSPDNLPALGDSFDLNRLRSLSDITEDFTSTNRRSATRQNDTVLEQINIPYANTSPVGQTEMSRITQMRPDTNFPLVYDDRLQHAANRRLEQPQNYVQERTQNTQMQAGEHVNAYPSRNDNDLGMFARQSVPPSIPMAHPVAQRYSQNLDLGYFLNNDGVLLSRPSELAAQHTPHGLPRPTNVHHDTYVEAFPSSGNNAQVVSTSTYAPQNIQRSQSVLIRGAPPSELVQYHRWSYPGRIADVNTSSHEAQILYALHSEQPNAYIQRQQQQPLSQPTLTQNIQQQQLQVFSQAPVHDQAMANVANMHIQQRAHHNSSDLYDNSDMSMYNNRMQPSFNNNESGTLGDRRNMSLNHLGRLFHMHPQANMNTGDVPSDNAMLQVQRGDPNQPHSQQHVRDDFDVENSPLQEQDHHYFFDY